MTKENLNTFINIETTKSLLQFDNKRKEYLYLMETLDKLLNGELESNEITTKNELELLHGFIKYNILICETSFDLSVILKYLSIIEDNLENSFFMKKGISICYEFNLAINKMLNSIRKIIEKSDNSIKEEYKLITKKFRDFKNKYRMDTDIKDIRNKISSHYELDFYVKNEILNTFNEISVAEMIGEINQIAFSILFLIHQSQRNNFLLLKKITNANKELS